MKISSALFTLKHTGYYDDGNGNPIIETRQHGACGVLIDQEAVLNPDTDFRCFDGDSLQQCDMIHEYQGRNSIHLKTLRKSNFKRRHV